MASASPTNALMTSMVTVAWAQLLTAACYAIWAMGLTYMKWEAGYMQLPVYGIIPVPYQLWTPQQLRWNNITVAFLCGAFCLYDAVNLEEWLYWIYVVRAVRTKSRQTQNLVGTATSAGHYPFEGKPSTNNSCTTTSFAPTMERKLRPSIPGKRAAKKTAKWITSNVFIVWLALSVCQTVIHYIIAFYGNPDVQSQTIRLYLAEGIFNTLTAVLSIVLAWQFPSFIRLVKDTGASYEVISKLQFYHELNKWRIFFRMLFSFATSTLGIDALTKAKRVNLNSLACDLLFQIAVLAFFFASICSWMLYLPVQWNKDTSVYGNDAIRQRPQLRRYVPPTNRGRRTGLALKPTDATFVAAAKALASPTSFTSPSTDVHPYSTFGDYEDAVQRRQIMSKHSEQHRTLIDLLRERGTISHDERLPEDDVFDEEAEAEAYGLGEYNLSVGSSYQPDKKRGADEEDEAFATALGEPLHILARLPAGVEPVYRAREIHERAPATIDLLPLVNFESPAGRFQWYYSPGFSRLSVPPKNVVINVSRDVEINRDEGDSRLSRMV
ncbi:hypothetical protein QFC22_005747 [Naganishia vaughanmartiniae]|uniref:Uncharacterized protein n=1 Tax=Naganishia vaughanmartiniae TaxID=1424756 RepID=A0ACC2WR94_9TREE|nr:hypothetical protein QFC22_005747 [Naganishia vaughanmartiniae]